MFAKAFMTGALGRLFRREDGISAVEFSLLSPVIVVGALMTADAGMAVYEKMMITQTLRSGAHSAIAAKSEASVLSILSATAGDNFTVVESATPGVNELGVQVSSYCICASDTSVQVACNTTCTGGTSPNQFYRLEAVKDFTGVMLPDFTLSGSIDVIAQ
ncbi:MAG: TadE/TadG family type IV pilus assembly protein [Pseudomonadota bacterium]